MKKFIGISLVAIMLLSIVLAISGCTSPTPTATPSVTPTPAPAANYTLLTAGKLAIATEAHYPPFENINTTNNTFEGFDIDLMNEIAKELGLQVVYTDHAFDTIITAVQTKKFDAAISAFTITPKRQETIDFTDWYYESPGQAIVIGAADTSVKNASDIVGKKIGVQEGTVGKDSVLAMPNVTATDVLRYASMNEAFMALKKGEVSVVVGDQPVCEPFIKNYPGDYKFAGEPLTATEYFGMVVNKDNSGLTKAINAALKKIKDDGRLQKIHDKWFE